MKIITIGYEGQSITDFINALFALKADVLLDVREIPISRKKGFSKNALSEHLQDSGIIYFHEKRFGSPKELRDKAKKDKDYRSFFSEFGKYLDSQTDALRDVVKNFDGTVVLMCFERDYRICHRSAVANKLSELTGSEVFHFALDFQNDKLTEH